MYASRRIGPSVGSTVNVLAARNPGRTRARPQRCPLRLRGISHTPLYSFAHSLFTARRRVFGGARISGTGRRAAEIVHRRAVGTVWPLRHRGISKDAHPLFDGTKWRDHRRTNGSGRPAREKLSNGARKADRCTVRAWIERRVHARVGLYVYTRGAAIVNRASRDLFSKEVTGCVCLCAIPR